MSAGCDGALDGIRVLDLTEDRGLYAGKVLADLGADVIKVEPPQGSRARSVSPFKDDVPGLENSLYFIHFNTNKKGITLNLADALGRRILRKLVRQTDVLIEDSQPGVLRSLRLDYPSLKRINRRLIMASVTGFGQDGPYRDFSAPDIVSFASGGLMHISGAANEPPVVAPCEQAYHASAMMTAYAVVSALFLRLRTNAGQSIDISAQEVAASFSQGIMRYSVTSTLGGRTGSQFWAAPARVYPCLDGHVHLLVHYPHHWRSFRELLGDPEELMDNAWYDSGFRARNRDLIDPLTTAYTLVRTRMQITQECQSRGIPCTPVNTAADIAEDRHFRARGFIGQAQHPVIGAYNCLNPSFDLSETPGRIRRPAPLLGQHNNEAYGEIGITPDQIAGLKSRGVI